MRHIIMMFAMILGFVLDIDAQVKTTDSIFIRNSRPINFVVDRIDISDKDRQWITDSLIPELKALGDRGIVLGRAAASPEGVATNNHRLAVNRRAAVDALLSSYGIATSRIHYNVVDEDFPMLRALMMLNNDPETHVIDSLMTRFKDFSEQLKLAARRYNGGKLWKRILKDYFPMLRAVRIMAIDRNRVDPDILPPVVPIKEVELKWPLCFSVPKFSSIKIPTVVFPSDDVKAPRRELLSVKTNLLLDFAYMPGYDRFCPIPNVAIEYYPLHGHFTYGASFDGPWWQHYNAHKYFQLRNYQIHTRYYLHSGDISLRKPGEGAAFKGWFFSAYAHAFLYNICFGERRGWEGEGAGAGLGIGYSLPLGKSEHWRLEFGLQAGWFFTDYDPYQWRCPIDPDSDTKQYYYKWYGDAKDFKKRQHRYTWLGPTRIEITLSYDLFYRKRVKK